MTSTLILKFQCQSLSLIDVHVHVYYYCVDTQSYVLSMVCKSASKGYVFTIHDWCWCGVVVEVESAGLRHCSLYSPPGHGAGTSVV